MMGEWEMDVALLCDDSKGGRSPGIRFMERNRGFCHMFDSAIMTATNAQSAHYKRLIRC